MSELFGIRKFDGWIEAEASTTGLGIYTASGALDGTSMDGVVAQTALLGLLVVPSGGVCLLVNPSTRTASVNMSGQSLTIPARGRVAINLPGSVRVQSSEPLAAVERTATATKLALNSAVSTSEGQSALVFPNAIAGSGYSSVLSVANVLSLAQDIAVTLGTTTATLHLEGNSATRVSIGDLLHLPPATITIGALRVAAGQGLFGGAGPALIGVLDIDIQRAC